MELFQPNPDWQYDDKRRAQEILPGLWLGPFSAALDEQFLTEAGITHVLLIRAPIEVRVKPKFVDRLQYFVIEVHDRPTESLIKWFPMTKQFIDSALHSGGRCLIHGNAGMSRSAAFAIAYVMETCRLTPEDAYQYVLNRRHCVTLNDGFKRQLREYELIASTMAMMRAKQMASDMS